MRPTFSLVINHTPWRPERVGALNQMQRELRPSCDRARLMINDRDYRGRDWQEAKVAWALDQWRWSVQQPTTHHAFMTDDLHLAPRFWDCLEAMVEATADAPAIGLLSNHPRGPELAAEGWRWYRTNSWLVGPAYVLEHSALVEFLRWFENLPDGPHTVEGTKAYRNDDSSINEWVTRTGRSTLHPLPTIVEHRDDLESTVGHGDKFSRERMTWRERRSVIDRGGGHFSWESEPLRDVFGLELTGVDFWNDKGGPAAAPMLQVGG